MTYSTKAARGGIAALAILPMLALAACAAPSSSGDGSNAAPTDGVLTIGLLGDIGQPPDPDIYYANNGLAIVLNTYEGLVQYADNVDAVEIAPRLAESWEVSADNTVYTFKLREGVVFHDGTEFTSQAVASSFERRRNVNGGAAYMVEGIASVDTPDATTAVVTLSAPNSAFLDYLASPFGPKMVSPAGLEKNAGDDFAQSYLETHDLGTGPYELTSAETGVGYELTQFEDYWGDTSPFTTVELPIYTDVSALELAFDEGDVSAVVAALPSSSLDKYADAEYAENYFLPTLQSALITANPSSSFFATVEARMAFMQSIDQETLVGEVLGARSEPATTLYAKGMIPGGEDEQTIEYDPSVMADYAAGLPEGEKSLVLGHANGNTNAEQIANIMAAQLQANGLEATAQGFETSEVFGWIEDPAAGPDAFVDGNNGPDGGSPYLWGHVFWDSAGGINYFQCGTPEVDAALNEGVATGDMNRYVEAAKLYEATGCYYQLSYNKDWVVAQSWLTGVAESHNIGANELNFAKLGIAE